jgi:hypothetical protein
VKLKLVFSTAVVFLAVVGVALATNHGDTVEEVCVNDTNGNVRWDDTCRNHETEVPIGGGGGAGTSFYIVPMTVAVAAFATYDVTASCNAGDSVTGGGVEAQKADNELFEIWETYPSSASSWRVTGRRFTTGDVTAYAVCATG